MKHSTIFSAIFVLLAVSCTTAPTPTVVPFVIAARVATATAMPSDTPTSTPTVTLTPTSTLAPTPAPVPMANIKLFKEFSFESGDVIRSGFTNPQRFFTGPTSYYDLVPDPTGQFDGKWLLHGVIKGAPPDTDVIRRNRGVHRPYPTFEDRGFQGHWAIEFDNLVLPTDEPFGYATGSPSNSGRWYSVVSIGNPNAIVAGASLITRATYPYLRLYTVMDNAAPVNVSDSNKLEYPIGKKARIRLELTKLNEVPSVRLFQGLYDKTNNFLGYTFISEAPLIGNENVFSGILLRVSAYAGENVRNLEIFNGNIKIYTIQ